MAKYGFNFRASSGYVTDPADSTYVTEDVYPTTRNGITFGWTTSVTNLQSRDRNSGVDARLAGTHYNDNDLSEFRVDLPASGDWGIRLAMGDSAFGSPETHVKILDNSTELISIARGTSIAGGEYYDASDTFRATAAAWASDNVQVSKTFATTTLILRILPAAGKWGNLAHLEVEQLGGSAATASLANGGLTHSRLIRGGLAR